MSAGPRLLTSEAGVGVKERARTRTNRSSSRRRKNKPMSQATKPGQDKSQQTGKTEVSQAQPTVGRVADIPSDQYTPEQQEAYRTVIEAEGLEQGAALPSAPLKIWIRNPKLSKAWAPLIWHFHPSHFSLSARERELVVSIITSKCPTPYTIYPHEPFSNNPQMQPEM